MGKKVLKLLSILLFVAFLIQCSFTPEYKRPEIILPSSLYLENGTTQIKDRWWEEFKDSDLNKLVEEALKNNEDLLIATARIEQALANLGFFRAELFPYIGYESELSRSKLSESYSKNEKNLDYKLSLAGFVSYEIDLWSKLRNQEKASLARLYSAKAEKEAFKITLISNIVTTYFNLIAIQKQFEIAEQYLEKLREIYEFRKKQYQNGLINELVVEQAKAEYEGTKIKVETLKNQKELLKTSLSLLIGRSPKELFEDNDFNLRKNLPQPLRPPSMLPSDLLERRPDIIAAEEKLKAANFEIGVAKAAYFPKIALTGALGYQSNELAHLITHGSSFWNLGLLIGGTVWDFGRIKFQVELKEAQKKEALYFYIKTVKTAFKEVYDALTNIQASEKKLQAQRQQVVTLKKVLELAEKKFENGLIDYLTVLDTQRNYLNALLNLVQYEVDLLNGYVFLYKALGGGFSLPKETSLTPPSN